MMLDGGRNGRINQRKNRGLSNIKGKWDIPGRLLTEIPVSRIISTRIEDEKGIKREKKKRVNRRK